MSKVHAATYWGVRGRTFCGIQVAGHVGDTVKWIGKSVAVSTTHDPKLVTCKSCNNCMA